VRDKKKTKFNLLTTLKKTIENHPIIAIFAGAIAVGVLVAGVMEYFHRQRIDIVNGLHKIEIDEINRKHKKEIEEYKDRTLSIERNIGKNRYFSVKNFFIKDQNDLQMSKMAEFHPDGNFYAPFDKSRWEKIQGREMEIYDSIYGTNYATNNRLTSDFMKIIGPIPKSYFWKGREELLIEGPSPIKRLFPFIHVSWAIRSEKTLAADKINKIFRMGLQSLLSKDILKNKESEISQFEKRIYKEDEYLANIETDIMRNMYNSMVYPNMYYKIRSIQRVEDIFYFKAETTLEGVVINGKKYDKYYITYENIGISTPKRTYFVKINVPSQDPLPRHEYFTWINDWLDDFKILVQHD
jgi:hypothetical protein